MDIRIDKNKLLKGLYLAHGIADRKSTMPILANVLIRTEGRIASRALPRTSRSR